LAELVRRYPASPTDRVLEQEQGRLAVARSAYQWAIDSGHPAQVLMAVPGLRELRNGDVLTT